MYISSRRCIGRKGIALSTRWGLAIIALDLLLACNGSSGNVASVQPAAVVHIDSAVASRAYLITDFSAGPFGIGAVIQDTVAGFEVEKSTESKTVSEGVAVEMPAHTYHIGNEGWVRVMPQYDSATGQVTDRTGEIFICSDLFLTDKGIGAISSFRELADAYPDFLIRYIVEDDMFAIVTPQLPNVQFLLRGEHYIGGDYDSHSGFHSKLNVSDFEENSYFSAVRICQQ